jgi:hypothetical protein
MPADDLPYDALQKQYELEDLSVSPVSRHFFKWLVRTPTAAALPSPWDKTFDKFLGWIKDRYSEDSLARVRLMLDTVEYRRYQRTHRRMTASSKCRPRNSAGRFRITGTPYQIRSARLQHNHARRQRFAALEFLPSSGPRPTVQS